MRLNLFNLQSLQQENIAVLSTIFDTIKQLENNGIINLHDIPAIIHTISTLFRAFSHSKKIYNNVIRLFTYRHCQTR
jgi:hypothetical protein